MSSLGQVAMAKAIRKDNMQRKSDAKKSQKQMKQQGWMGGVGRGLLGLAGALTFGPAGAGIGSWLGTKGGEAIAGKVDDVRDTDFGINATEDMNDDIKNYRSNANTMAVGRGITDAFSAYVAPEMLNKAGEKIATWGADKPQFLGGFGARKLGIGGDKYAENVTSQGLADNPYLKAEQGLSEDQITDLFWNEKGVASSPTTPSSAISNTAQPALSPVPAQNNILNQAVSQNGTSPFSNNPYSANSSDARAKKFKEFLSRNNNLAQQLTGMGR